MRPISRSISSPGLAAILLLALACVTRGTSAEAPPVEASTPAGEVVECDTHLAWERMKAELGIGGIAGGCEEGPCDVASMRDAFIPGPGSPVRTFRVHFIVLREDDGTNAAATSGQITQQAVQMVADFQQAGIDFEWTSEFVNDSTYRALSESEIDPMKNAYAVSPATQCNVFVTDLSPIGIGGRGTFPWQPDQTDATGGIIIDEGSFGAGLTTMTHEMGHNLGLWHTHHGVSEQQTACGTCWERADGVNGDSTGDFCSDTPPTPTNNSCSDPGGTDSCSNTPWGATQWWNFMGYASSVCRTTFTPQQIGRMWCWSDVQVAGWWYECPGTGDCYAANGTPGCADIDCCQAVCAVDPFCCDNQWDQVCADQAPGECGPLNDECANHLPIFEGVTPFDTFRATLDGPDHAACGAILYGDIWYTYIATCNGDLTVSTCGTTGEDSNIAIYEDCACPTDDSTLLACASNTPGCDGDAEATVTVQAGGCYLIRVGGFGDDSGLQGSITVTCDSVCGAGSGDCYDANGTPGCEDVDCCDLICGVDPFCCGTQWDGQCASEATQLCEVQNDDCVDSLPIADGIWEFSTFGATLDGPTHAGCSGTGDIWYDYVAPCDGHLRVTTCEQSNEPFSVFVYDGCVCPQVVGNLLDCNTSSTDCPAEAIILSVPVQQGQCYAIRIGGFGDDSGIQGQIELVCAAGIGACCLPDDACTHNDDAICAVLGGVFQGVATSCADITCSIDVCPGAGSCCEPNGSIGCSDAACCEAVCAIDTFCCDDEWDQLCADEALSICGDLCCPADFDGDMVVGVTDLLELLAAWGTSAASYDIAPPGGDGTIDTQDLLAMLAAWGPCGDA